MYLSLLSLYFQKCLPDAQCRDPSASSLVSWWCACIYTIPCACVAVSVTCPQLLSFPVLDFPLTGNCTPPGHTWATDRTVPPRTLSWLSTPSTGKGLHAAWEVTCSWIGSAILTHPHWTKRKVSLHQYLPGAHYLKVDNLINRGLLEVSTNHLRIFVGDQKRQMIMKQLHL